MTPLVRVERIGATSPAVAAVAARTPFTPHRWLRPDAPEMLAALVRARLEHGIAESGGLAWSASVDEEVSAVAVLRPLAWDSRILGFSAARIELVSAGAYEQRSAAVDAVLREALLAAKPAGIQHVSARVDGADTAAIHGLERRGFLNVDALVTFGARLGGIGASSARLRVREAAPTDHERVGDIAAESFLDGRFHADPTITTEAASRIYRNWAIACCEGSAADVVLVAEDAEAVVGFIACRMQPDTAVHLRRPAGTIVLVAAAAPARGRGVGADLIAAATSWFGERQAVGIEVGTHLSNVAAARLYERCGFRLVAAALSFRIAIDT